MTTFEIHILVCITSSDIVLKIEKLDHRCQSKSKCITQYHMYLIIFILRDKNITENEDYNFNDNNKDKTTTKQRGQHA